MDQRYLRAAVGAVALLTAAGANATLLRSSGTYSSTSTTEPSGFRCGSFHDGPGALSECTDSAFYVDGGTGNFFQVDYSSKGSASYGALKTSSSLVFTPSVPDPTPPPVGEGPAVSTATVDVRELPSGAYAEGGASFRDNWTITGAPAGTVGTLRLGYALDGTSTSPFVNAVAVSSSTTLRIAELEMVTLPSGTVLTRTKQNGTVYNSGFNGTVNTVVQLELDFVFGQEFILSVFMDSLSAFDFVTPATPGFATSSDFFNTALLSQINVLNASGAPVMFTLRTASGAPVFQQFSTPGTGVPSPATLVLCLAGLLTLATRNKR